MKKLIANADDFGLTYGVSSGIIEAFKKGIVRSTSVMVNLPNIEDILRLAKTHAPELDLGIHLNLTFGQPVTPVEKVPSLVDENGFFWRKPDIVIQKANLDEIKTELKSQIEKALLLEKDLRIKFSHIDSHHHIHKKKEVFDIYLELAANLQLPVRSNDLEMSKFFKSKKIKTPDFFSEEFYGVKNVTLEKLKQIIQELPEGVTELCCHPGKVDTGLFKLSSYVKERQQELKVLISPEVFDYLKEYGVKLVSFKDI